MTRTLSLIKVIRFISLAEIHAMTLTFSLSTNRIDRVGDRPRPGGRGAEAELGDRLRRSSRDQSAWLHEDGIGAGDYAVSQVVPVQVGL